MGCVRQRNEDAFTVLSPTNGPTPGRNLLALVADGMGGHRAGDRASRLAVETIGRVFLAATPPVDRRLAEAFQAANRAIYDEAADDAALSGMGTTATALVVSEGAAWLAHVGDSRLYRLHDERLEQLSEDDTLVEGMLKKGLLTPQEAKFHPERHVLARAMGTHARLEVMLAPVPLAPGDSYLLCTDGLHDLVDDEEIRLLLLQHGPQAACDALVALARQRGGYDNISVVAVQCGMPDLHTSDAPPTRDVVQQFHE
jgi:protein phosphatase